MVTPEQLARAIGEQFLLARTRKKLSTRALSRRGGPTWPTIEAIERGDLGYWDKLAAYSTALGVPFDDILRAVLGPDLALSPDLIEWLQVGRALSSSARGILILAARLMLERERGPKE